MTQDDFLSRERETFYAGERLQQVLDIGQEMLQCGGEVSRVEDSIRRLGRTLGAEQTDVFAITSQIVVTVRSRAFGAITQTRRVVGRPYDLRRLERLNQLSRRICAGELTLDDTGRELAAIRAEASYPFWAQLLAYTLSSAAFSLFFGGSWADAAASGLIGAALKCMNRLSRQVTPSAFLRTFFCSCAGGALAALSVRLGLGESVDLISIGNIMLLIPGIPLTNSLRDMFTGNTISGIMRFMEAILTALFIAFGFVMTAALF